MGPMGSVLPADILSFFLDDLLYRFSDKVVDGYILRFNEDNIFC